MSFRAPEWVSIRPWEVVFWRLATLAFAIGLLSVAIDMAREGHLLAGAIFPLVFCALGLRYVRSVSLGIGFLRDRLVVCRALGLGREEIPFESVGCCVTWGYLGSRHVYIYVRPRWRAPIILMTSFLGGIRVEDWVNVTESLRRQFEPDGKWRRFPWWRSPSWL